MYKYKCVKCNGEQYSASENKENEPCIYCDAESVILEEKNARRNGNSDRRKRK